MYVITMPTKSRTKTKQNKDGTTSESLIVEFSNGSLEQLKELAKFFKAPESDPALILELGISILQRVKEDGKAKMMAAQKTKKIDDHIPAIRLDDEMGKVILDALSHDTYQAKIKQMIIDHTDSVPFMKKV